MMILPMIGQGIIWIIMICAVIGVIGAIKDPSKGIGREFMLAFEQLGIIFIPFAGILASMPYIEKIVVFVFGKLFHLVGADVALAGALFIPPDMGGYQLYTSLASSPETWIIALFLGFMAGPIVAYSIPLGFSIIEKEDRKYFGLGIMAGILSIPFAVFISVFLLKVSNTPVRGMISNTGSSDINLVYSWKIIMLNMLPIIIFCILLVLMLKFFMDIMIKLFLVFGRGLEIAIKVVLVISIVEYFTGIFAMIFGSFGFSPIIADEVDQFRALENAGYIAIMLAGAYPMIYLIKKYAGTALQKIGEKVGFSSIGSIGLFATWAEQLAMFGIMKKMPPSDKVKVTAFSVCGSWILGAHLTYAANFQPNLLAILLIGKFVGGCIAVFFAIWIAVPIARKYEKKDREEGIIAEDEYLEEEGFLDVEKI